MQERHTNRQRYFNEQSTVTERYVIPYIRSVAELDESSRVLEIGCGEGGNMKPFLDMNMNVIGIDLAANKVANAHLFFQDHPHYDKLTLVVDDVYNMKRETTPDFDLIFMRDTLEHIHNQERFMRFIKDFLGKDGKLFLGFPPWRMPFGGHQQICKSKFLSKLPYFHLLPRAMYTRTMKIFGESENTIEALVEIRDTGISVKRFRKILAATDMKIVREEFYFINPNYEIKFGMKPRKIWGFLKNAGFVRDLFTTTCYYVVANK